MPALYPAFFFVLEKTVKSAGNAVIPTFPMHWSHGLQGSLKRRYKHPSPTSINGYHTAKKLLSQSPAKRPTFAFTGESGYTLAFQRKIAHNGSHGETGGISDGGAITTLGAFRTFTNIPELGVRTAYFAALGSWPGILPKAQTVNKVVNSPRRKGRVCAGNPRRVSCAIEILSFQNFYKVLKTCSAGRKDFFDTLRVPPRTRRDPFASSRID